MLLSLDPYFFFSVLCLLLVHVVFYLFYQGFLFLILKMDEDQEDEENWQDLNEIQTADVEISKDLARILNLRVRKVLQVNPSQNRNLFLNLIHQF